MTLTNLSNNLRPPLPRWVLEAAATEAIEQQRRKQQAQTVQPIPTYPNPSEWIQSHFYIPETNKPITLAPYQVTALNEALRRENNRFVYSTIIWSDLKKTAKTTIAGAVSAYIAYMKSNAYIRLVGNDLKQADSRVFNAIDTAIKLNPQWRDDCKVIQHRITFPNGSIIESVPVDPQGEAGGNDDMLEWTELWAATHTAHQKMWNELTLSPTKFGQSFRWVDTYAGYSGESEILERLYNVCVKPENKIDLGIDGLGVYAKDSMFCLWNTQPRLAWLTKEYYAQEEINLDAHEFRRLHSNEWVTSSQTFVPLEWWNACQVNKLNAIAQNESLVIALDAAVSGDCFGLVMVAVRFERRGNKVATIIQPRYVKKWTPQEDGKDGKIDYDNTVEPELKRLLSKHNVIEVCYDPYQLHEFCTRLARETNANFQEFNQGADRLIADKQLYDLIRDRCIEHLGEADLTEHIKNANSKTENERLRIVKRSESLKIDLAVCLSMASKRIMDLVFAPVETEQLVYSPTRIDDRW